MAKKQKIATTIFSILALLLILSLSVLQQHTVNATVVFTDDFDDGNYDGWGTTGLYLNGTDFRVYPTTGNFSAADNTLKATGPAWNDSVLYNHNLAYIESSTAYGSWTFDILVVDNPAGFFGIAFMIDAVGSLVSSEFPPPHPNNTIVLWILTHARSGWWDRPSISLWKMVNSTGYDLDFAATGPSLGVWPTAWNHFEITRNSTGHISVYLNDTLTLEDQDTQVTTSNYFIFWAQTGQALDNLIIDDGLETTPPPPIPGFPIPAIAIGLTLSLGLLVILRRRRT